MPPVKDYSKSKIYIIQPIGGLEYYLGSTTQKLCKRIEVHRRHYREKDKNQCSVKILFDKYEV